MSLQKIIKKFVSYDEMRFNLLSAWVREDKLCATNGHILLLCPAGYASGLDVDRSDDAGINTSECMKSEDFKDFDLSLLSDAVKSQEPSYIIEPSFEKCEECWGEGEYETDDGCDHCHSRGTKTVSCHECQGRGSSTKPNPLKGEKRYETTKTTLQLPQGKILADWKYLNVIQETMDFFKGTWKVANRNDIALIHFKQNEEDINIVLMPMRP